MELDFSRPPTVKERIRLQARLHRLLQPEQVERIDALYGSMPGELPESGLVVRNGFSYRATGVAVDASDRKAPPTEFRPPATRLLTSRGSALRFAVTLLAIAQANRKPGDRARIDDLGLPIVGDSKTLAWASLLETGATDSRTKSEYITARIKRARSVRSALEVLAAAGLVWIPGEAGVRNRFESFMLLDERGREVVGEREEYRVPRKSGEPTFTMPAGFVTNGWMHVLEDSEIAVLFMVACKRGGWDESGLIAMPADVRLLHYGIHRDAYSSARKTLEWLGLLRVDEIGRHDDGRAENADLRVHRLGLLPDGFEERATTRMTTVLQAQIARS